jgi:hypothetical protein
VRDIFPRTFALLAALAAAFIWLTSRSLPGVVASHFEADGYANGFTSRGAYVGMMLVLDAGLPALLVTLTHFALGSPKARINLPNRDYWLAPERRDETVAFLRAHAARFAGVLMAFLCYVHWLVVRANEAQPARLSSSWVNAGVAAFLVFAVIWTRMLLRRFRRRPPGPPQ